MPHRLMIPYSLQPDDQLCFVHIPKTAGSAVLSLLDGQFPPAAVCEYRHIEPILQLPPAQRAGYQFVRAHGAYPQFRQIRPQPSLYMTFLRDPVERVLSFYYFVRSSPHNDYYSEVSKLTLPEFIAWDSSHRWMIESQMTRLLTGNKDYQTPPDVHRARQILRDEFVFHGLTERFDESIALLGFIFGWRLPGSSPAINVNPHRPRRGEISPRLLERIRELNQADMELYEYASQLFEQQVRLMQALRTLQRQFDDTRQRLEDLVQATPGGAPI